MRRLINSLISDTSSEESRLAFEVLRAHPGLVSAAQEATRADFINRLEDKLSVEGLTPDERELLEGIRGLAQ
jgi:hypothetical protein